MHVISKYCYHKWIDHPDKWYPFLSVFYLTNACDFRCPYCSDGSGTPYYELPSDVLSDSQVLNLLGIIRQKTDSVVITGGEPLKYPGFECVMERLAGLQFKQVGLTTNGHDLDPCLPAIASSVNSLVFSLDTLEHEKADAWYGIGKGALDRILQNIDLAAAYPQRKYEIFVSSVVTPDNIEDIYEVYRFTQKRGFTIAVAPQLLGVKAPDSFKENPHYRALYEFLITEKKHGAKIFGSVLYLEYMRDLKIFRCHPFTMLVVSPLGDVFYPCLEIGHFAGNLFEQDNLHDIRQNGRERFGPQPACGTRCHSACALSFALALHHPASLLYDAYLMAKSKMYN